MYNRDGISNRCTNQCFQPCTKYNKFCAGKNSANYVYKISKTITVQNFSLFLSLFLSLSLPFFLSFFVFFPSFVCLFCFLFLLFVCLFSLFVSVFVSLFVCLLVSFLYLFNLISPTEDGSCEVEINPVGCYKEKENHLAMQHIFHNEALPSKPNFVGNMLPFSGKYEVEFPEFLCRCARVAKQNGWEYFGVRDMG